MTGLGRKKRRVRLKGRYRRLAVGRVQVLIRHRPDWQAGVPTAQAFAQNLNAARELAGRIRRGEALGHDVGNWRLRARWYGAWRGADAILLPSVREGRLARPWAPQTVRRFDRFSAVNRLRFTLDAPALMVVEDDARHVVLDLFCDFFRGRAPGRLKSCAACRRWFADETRNRGQRWCSEPCHRRGWNRAARRAARHAQYAAAKKRGARR